MYVLYTGVDAWSGDLRSHELTDRSISQPLYVTRPAKIDHVSTKNRRFSACLLYHNLITIYTTATKSSSLLENLMGVLLQLTEMG